MKKQDSKEKSQATTTNESSSIGQKMVENLQWNLLKEKIQEKQPLSTEEQAIYNKLKTNH